MKGTNHLSNELEASRKLHPKHIQLLLINEPLLDTQQDIIKALHVTCVNHLFLLNNKANSVVLKRKCTYSIYQWSYIIFKWLRSGHERPPNGKRASLTDFAYFQVKQAKERNNPVRSICHLWCHKVHCCLSKGSDNIPSWVFRQPVWPPNSCLGLTLLQTWSLAGN